MADRRRAPLGAWMIALSCFWINMFIFSIVRSSGVVYIALLETFNCTYEQASYPLSIAPGIASMSGLPVGFLSHYFTVRTLTSFGAALVSVSISLCCLARDVRFILTFLGVFQGIGIGFTVLLLPAIINQYFGAEKAMACGLSYAGVAIGSFVLPLIMEYLINGYGLRGALLITGALTSHALLGTLLLRPHRSQRVTANPRENSAHQRSARFSHSSETKKLGQSYSRVQADLTSASGELTSLTTSRRPNKESQVELLEDGPLCVEVPKSNNDQNKTSVHLLEANGSPESKPRKTIGQHLRHDLNVVKNVHFFLTTFVYCAYLIAYISIALILPGFAIDRGLTLHQGVVITSLWSITDLLGRLLPGWLSYKGLVTNKTSYVGSITLMGILLLLMPPFAEGFLSLSAFALSFGFLVGCQMVLPPVIMAEYLGVDNTAFAFGFANFISGCLSPFRAMLIGKVGVKLGLSQQVSK